MPLSLQQLTGAAERLRAAKLDLGVDWLALVEQARAHSSQQPFVPAPLNAFRKQDDSGKKRLITQASPAERLIEEALRPQLEEAVASVASDAVHGYRPGRSTYTAALAASRGLAAGCHYLLAADIHDFFGRVNWKLLDERLAATLPETVAKLTAALAKAPLRFGNNLRRRNRGIPLGRVISPFLANLYLAPVDAAMDSPPGRYIRYADDLLVLADTEDALENPRQTLEAALAAAGLALNPDKTDVQTYVGAPLPYLGHAVDERGVYDRVAGARLARIEAGRKPSAAPQEASPHAANRRSHTLYLTEPGLYLHMESGVLVIRRGKKLIREIPLHRIDRVLVLTGASMSSGFFAECIARKIPVLFFIGKGKAFGSLVASGMPNPWRLRAQYELLSDDAHRLQLARDIVTAKIAAMRRKARDTRDAGDARRALGEVAGAAQSVADLRKLRGCEGRATGIWYDILRKQIRREGFALHKRSKRPPRDPINSLLSFAYSLVFGEMQSALLGEGLDPHPGLLHESRPGHAALASDLIEPYRILVADTFVRGLINRGRVHPDEFFKQKNGGVYLQNEARKRTLEAFESYMESPEAGNALPAPRPALAGAANSMLRVVLGETHDLDLPFPYQHRNQ